MGQVATQPLPPGGSPTLHSGRQNQKWPINGSERGTKSEVAHKWVGWLHNPCGLGGGGSAMLENGGQSQKWPTSGPGGYKVRFRTAPIITVIIQVTTLKTTHLRNHAQSIQNSKFKHLMLAMGPRDLNSFFFLLTLEVQRVLKTVLGKVGVSGI